MRTLFKTLFIAAIVFFAACSSSGSKNGKANTSNEAAVQTEDSIAPETKTEACPDELAMLRDELSANGYVCAAAYIGTILDGRTETEFINDSEYKTSYPFIPLIDEKRIVRNEGDEVYCIVPAKGYDKVTVSTFVVDESNDYKGAADKELYSASDGKPILVRGNISEIMPNVIVTLSNGEDVFSFNPSLSMRDGSLNRYNIKDKVQDITIYDPSMVFEED